MARLLTPEEEAELFGEVPETSPDLLPDAPPPPASGIPEDVRAFASAADADKAAAHKRWQLGMINAGAQQMIGNRVQAPEYEIPSEVKNYVLRRGMERDGRRDAIDETRAQADLLRAQGKGPDLDKQPAPPEWGALPGMTRSEALRAGYGKAEKPDDDLDPAVYEQAAADATYLGYDPGLAQSSPKLALRIIEMAQQRRNAGIAAGRQEDEAERRRQAETDKDTRKRADDTFIADDFEPGESARPVEGSVRSDLFKQASNGSSIIKNARELRTLVKQHGGGAVTGPVASRMSALATDLVMGGKNLYGLGVLNPNDEEVLSRIIADPTKISSIVRDASGVRSLEAIYKALEDVTRGRVVDAFRQAGHRPKAGSVFAASGGGGAVRKFTRDASGRLVEVK